MYEIAFLKMAALGALGLLETSGLLGETVAATVVESVTAPSGIAAATTAIGAGTVIANLPSRKGKTMVKPANYNNPNDGYWVDTEFSPNNYVTPKRAKTDTIGDMTSKRQKIAQSKETIVAKNLFPKTPVSSSESRVGAGHAGFEAEEAARGSAAATSLSNMSYGNDHEVPVAKVPRLISKIHPDVFNIRLPFYATCHPTNTSLEFENKIPIALIRLNSIYDVFKNSHTQKKYQVNPYPTLASAALTAANANDPVAAATTVAANPTLDADIGPVGRNLWQGHFKYYRVLRSDVKLTFINRNCDQDSNNSASNPSVDTVNSTHNMYAIGYELIDEDAMVCQNVNAFMTAKHVVRDIMAPAMGQRISTGAYVASKPAIGVMQYTYHPENWTKHVEQLGTETRWTAVGSNPALDHLMALRAFHISSIAQARGGAPNLSIIVQVEFEVQFRECLDNFIKEGYLPPSNDT